MDFAHLWEVYGVCVKAYFSFPTTHILTDANKALCGTKIQDRFGGDIRATNVPYEMVNCKKCKKKVRQT
jgi:hypothetical protein